MKKIVSFTIILTLLFTCFACIPMQAKVLAVPVDHFSSGDYDERYPASNLSDGRGEYETSGWISKDTLEERYVGAEYAEAIRIKRITIYFNGFSNVSYPNYNENGWGSPIKYQIQGSNDMLDWDTLVDGDNTKRANAAQHVLNTEKAYKYVRLYIPANEYCNDGQSVVRIREMFVEPLAEAQTLSEIYFEDADGNAVNSIASNTKVYAKADMTNTTEEPFNAILLAGIYNADGKLLMLSTSAPVECPGNDVASLSTDITPGTVAATDQLRAFIYKDLLNIKPLSGTSVLTTTPKETTLADKLVLNLDLSKKFTETYTTGKEVCRAVAVNTTFSDGACNFDGTGYVDIYGFDYELGDNFSIVMRTKDNNYTAGFHQLLVKDEKNVGDMVNLNPRHFEVYVSNTVLDLWAPNGVYGGASGAIADADWHDIAITYDGANVNIYLDGALKTTSETTGSFAGEFSTLRIGKLLNDDMAFNGAMQYVSIYDSALSADEVAALAE